jgi:phage gp29-like protein
VLFAYNKVWDDLGFSRVTPGLSWLGLAASAMMRALSTSKVFLMGHKRHKHKFAAKPMGRPRGIEGEKMVVSNGLMASLTRPGEGGVYFMPIDEIVRRHGWRTYKEMRSDDQVKASLAFKRILVRGRTWEFAPADKKSEQAKKVAQFCTWAMQRVNLDQVFEEALSALEFGFALSEKVFERTTWEGKQVVALKKLAFRDPETIDLQSDTHGNWMGARQKNVVGQVPYIDLGTDKLWLWTYNGRFGNLYGEPDLRAAYRSWWAKKFVINFWNVYLERMGAPMTAMKYPNGASQDLKDTLKEILRGLASKTEILIPEGVQIDLIEAKRAGKAEYGDALAFHNNAIARAILMISLLGTGSEAEATRGSEGQSFLQLRILFKMADEVSKALACSLMEQVIRQLVEFNFDGDVDELMPKFIWQDYGQFEGMKIADTIRLLHAAGILDLDQKDVNYARSVLGLPLRGPDDPEDEVIRPPEPPPPGDANSPPPAADQGNQRAKKGGAEAKQVSASEVRLGVEEDPLTGKVKLVLMK